MYIDKRWRCSTMQDKKFSWRQKVCGHVTLRGDVTRTLAPRLLWRRLPSHPPLGGKLPPELARNWSKGCPFVVTVRPLVRLNFSSSRLFLRNEAGVSSVLSMHGSDLGAAKGEGRSPRGRCRLRCRARLPPSS